MFAFSLGKLARTSAVVFALTVLTTSTSSAQGSAASGKGKADTTKVAPKMGMDHGAMMDHDKMEAEHGGSGWKELDAFHTLLAASFHPAQSRGDLAPVRAKAADMNAAAKKWAASTAPTGCDSPAIKTALADVAKGSQLLADLVAKSADDASVKASITAVHTRFETVEMNCKPVKK